MTPAEPQEPQEQLEEQPQQDYGEKNIDLPEQMQQALKETVKEFQGQERYLRRREVMRARRNHFYERGFQHIYWQNGQNAGYTLITAGGTAINASGQSVQAPRYVDDYNLFQPYERVISSILTQNPPGIDFRPMDEERPEDVDAAETAEGYRKLFDRSNSVKQIQMEVVRSFCLDGRTIMWTRTETNEELWGTDVDGSPKMMETCTVHGVLESKVPILAKCQEECLYVLLSDDPDIKQAKAKYRDFADKIKPGIAGLGENAYERLARLGVLQGSRSEMLSNDSYTHLVTRMYCWLRTNAFTGERYDEPSDDFPDMTLGDAMRQVFPTGCLVTFVGDTYVGSEDACMDDCLHICFPYEGDGMNRMAIMDPFVVVQDAFNDGVNASREVFDVGWPSTWLNGDQQDIDAVASQRADPYAIRPFKARATMSMADEFFREPNPELPATFLQFMDNLQGPLAQFILAAPPALFGGAMEDQKTASGYAQARAQAMGQQGLIWAQMQDAFACMYYQAALWAAKNPQHAQGVLVPGGANGTAAIQITNISKGKFGAYPDEDSSFPESQAAKRGVWDAMFTMLGNNPEMIQQLLAVPENVERYLSDHGMAEIKVPESISYRKQQFEIKQLLQQAPIPPDPQMQDEAFVDHAAAAIVVQQSGTGAQIPPPPQVPPQSSVPVNDYDFHQWEAAACQDWLNSDDCRRQQAQGNDVGVQNVVLHWREHVARIPPPMPLAAPPAAKPPSTGTPAKGPQTNLLPSAVNPPGLSGAPTM